MEPLEPPTTSEELFLAPPGDGEPTDTRISGWVLDPWERRPLAQVQIRQRLANEELSQEITRTDLQGRFALRSSVKGLIELSFEREGYRPHTLKVPVPHHGQARRIRVHLWSYRALIFRAYHEEVLRIRGKIPLDVTRDTSREIARRLQEDSPKEGEQFAPLARAFEIAYYAPAIPDEETYKEILTLASSPPETDSPGQQSPTD